MRFSALLTRTISPAAKSGLLVFGFFFSIYAFTSQGSIQSADGKIMYLLTQSLLERGSLAHTEQVSLQDPDGEKYSKYGVGMSLLAVPFYLAGKMLAQLLGIPAGQATLFCVGMLNAFVTAFNCALLHRFATHRFGFRAGTANLLALAFGLSSIAWYYSEDFMSEPATTGLLLAAAYCLTGEHTLGTRRSRLLAGLFLGCAATTRLAALVALPGFVLYLLARCEGANRASLKAFLRETAALAAPVLVFLAAIGIYNQVRLGHPLETGYESGFQPDFFTGFFGLLFSPGKSVFVYNPVLLCGCLALPLFFRSRPQAAILFGWIVAAHLMLFSFWHSWYGGMGWGSRLMAVTLPFWILPVGFLLDKPGLDLKRGFAAAVALGIVVQIPSLIVNPARYHYDLRERFPVEAEHLLLYSPLHSPAIQQIRQVAVVLSGLTDEAAMRERVALAQAGKRFLGGDNREVLEKGLAVNAPNFWWYYMYRFGYPAHVTFVPAALLLLSAWLCGVTMFRTHRHRPSLQSTNRNRKNDHEEQMERRRRASRGENVCQP